MTISEIKDSKEFIFYNRRREAKSLLCAQPKERELSSSFEIQSPEVLQQLVSNFLKVNPASSYKKTSLRERATKPIQY